MVHESTVFTTNNQLPDLCTAVLETVCSKPWRTKDFTWGFTVANQGKGADPRGKRSQKAKQYWISAQILTFPCRKVSIYLVQNFCTCIPYEKIWRRNDYESGMWNPILPSVYASLSPTGRTRRLAPGSSFAYICIWIRQLVCWQNYRHCSGVTFDSQSSFLCAILSAPTVRDG